MNNNRVMLISDTHARKNKTDEFLINWREAVSVAKKENVGTILFGGDMFYSTANQTLDVLMAVREVIEMCYKNNIDLIAIYGNHDIVNRESELSYLHVFDGLMGFKVLPYFNFKTDNYIVSCVGYVQETSKDVFVEKLNNLKNETKDYDTAYAFVHEGINGALSGNVDENKELPVHIFDNYDTVFAGHYHNRASFDNIQYIGSSRQFNFGEDEEKGYTIINEDGSHFFVKNEANKRFITHEIDFARLQKYLATLSENVNLDMYSVRLKINVKKSKAATINKQLIYEAGVSKLEINNLDDDVVAIATQTSFRKFNIHELAQTYVEFCESEKFSANLGLKYIKQIN